MIFKFICNITLFAQVLQTLQKQLNAKADGDLFKFVKADRVMGARARKQDDLLKRVHADRSDSDS